MANRKNRTSPRELVNKKNEKSRARVRKEITFAIIPVIIAGLIPIIFFAFQHTFRPPNPHLEIDGLTVQESSSPASAGTTRIRIILRNTGNQLAVVKYVYLNFENSIKLTTCMDQGAIEPGKVYGRTLPRDLMQGSTFKIGVAESVSPDSYDSFVLALHLPKEDTANIHLLRFQVALAYDNSPQTVNAGDVIAALPMDPTGDFVWTNDSAKKLDSNVKQARAAGRLYPSLSNCLIANSKSIRIVLAHSATRSGPLYTLSRTIAYCCKMAPPPLSKIILASLCGEAEADPAHKPKSIMDFCQGDINWEIGGIKWKKWNNHEAYGVGLWESIFRGHPKTYNTIIKLTDPVANDSYKEYVWNKAVLIYPSGGPHGIRRKTLLNIDR